jgi:hypothetical protein
MVQHADPSFGQELGDNAGTMRRCIVVQKLPAPTFLQLKPNAMN